MKRGDQPVLGVVMLDTRFPRLVGDIGNPDTFPFATLCHRVPGASVASVVRTTGPSADLRGAIVDAALDLEARGATLVATSCGFLAGLQAELQQALRVPVISSSLSLLPAIAAWHGLDRIGVLSFDAALCETELLAGMRPPTIGGLDPRCELYRVIAEDRPVLDREQAERDVLDAASSLLERAPGATPLAAILLECTNLSPYRRGIVRLTGCSVYDINGGILGIARAQGWEAPIELLET